MQPAMCVLAVWLGIDAFGREPDPSVVFEARL
jgi:hypothetical protein